MNLLATIHRLLRLGVVAGHFCPDTGTLLIDPRGVVPGQHAQGIDQRVNLQRREALHIEQATTDHLAHGRAIGWIEAGRLRHLHLVLRHHRGAHLGGQRHVVCGFGMDGNAMAHGEFDAVAVDHLQRFALRVHTVGVQYRPAPEDGAFGGILLRTNDQLGLKHPCRIAVGVRLFLCIHQKQRDQPIAIGILGPDGALHAHFGKLVVGSLMWNHAFGQRQHDLAATGNALPHLGLGLHLRTGFLVLAGAEYLMLVAALIPAPARFDLDPVGITIHAEGHAETAGHQRLVAGGIDLVRRIRFRLHTPGGRSKLRTRLVPSGSLGLRGRLKVVIGQWPVQPLNAALCGLTRGQFANQVAVAHTHVDNTFTGATSGAEQVVHHGQLQQFADIGLILDGRHFGDGLVQCLGERLQEVCPLNTANAAGRRRGERRKANRNSRINRQHAVEVDRGGFQIRTNPQHPPDARDVASDVQDQHPIVIGDGLIQRTLALQPQCVGSQREIGCKAMINRDPCVR